MPFSLEQKKDAYTLTAQGSDVKDAFLQGALGLFSLQRDSERVSDGERIKIVIDAPDIASLFAAWLEELIVRQDEGQLVLGDFRVASVQKVNDNQYLLTGEAYGEPFDPQRHSGVFGKPRIKKGPCSESRDGATCSCDISLPTR